MADLINTDEMREGARAPELNGGTAADLEQQGATLNQDGSRLSIDGADLENNIQILENGDFRVIEQERNQSGDPVLTGTFSYETPNGLQSGNVDPISQEEAQQNFERDLRETYGDDAVITLNEELSGIQPDGTFKAFYDVEIPGSVVAPGQFPASRTIDGLNNDANALRSALPDALTNGLSDAEILEKFDVIQIGPESFNGPVRTTPFKVEYETGEVVFEGEFSDVPTAAELNSNAAALKSAILTSNPDRADELNAMSDQDILDTFEVTAVGDPSITGQGSLIENRTIPASITELGEETTTYDFENVARGGIWTPNRRVDNLTEAEVLAEYEDLLENAVDVQIIDIAPDGSYIYLDITSPEDVIAYLRDKNQAELEGKLEGAEPGTTEEVSNAIWIRGREINSTSVLGTGDEPNFSGVINENGPGREYKSVNLTDQEFTLNQDGNAVLEFRVGSNPDSEVFYHEAVPGNVTWVDDTYAAWTAPDGQTFLQGLGEGDIATIFDGWTGRQPGTTGNGLKMVRDGNIVDATELQDGDIILQPRIELDSNAGSGLIGNPVGLRYTADGTGAGSVEQISDAELEAATGMTPEQLRDRGLVERSLSIILVDTEELKADIWTAASGNIEQKSEDVDGSLEDSREGNPETATEDGAVTDPKGPDGAPENYTAELELVPLELERTVDVDKDTIEMGLPGGLTNRRQQIDPLETPETYFDVDVSEFGGAIQVNGSADVSWARVVNGEPTIEKKDKVETIVRPGAASTVEYSELEAFEIAEGVAGQGVEFRIVNAEGEPLVQGVRMDPMLYVAEGSDQAIQEAQKYFPNFANETASMFAALHLSFGEAYTGSIAPENREALSEAIDRYAPELDKEQLMAALSREGQQEIEAEFTQSIIRAMEKNGVAFYNVNGSTAIPDTYIQSVQRAVEAGGIQALATEAAGDQLVSNIDSSREASPWRDSMSFQTPVYNGAEIPGSTISYGDINLGTIFIQAPDELTTEEDAAGLIQGDASVFYGTLQLEDGQTVYDLADPDNARSNDIGVDALNDATPVSELPIVVENGVVTKDVMGMAIEVIESQKAAGVAAFRDVNVEALRAVYAERLQSLGINPEEYEFDIQTNLLDSTL